MNYREARMMVEGDEVVYEQDNEIYLVASRPKLGVYMGKPCVDFILRNKKDGKLMDNFGYVHHTMVQKVKK